MVSSHEKAAPVEDPVVTAAANTSVQVDGEEGHLRLVATEGGQVLLSAAKEPLPEECAAKVQKVIAENKEVAEKVGQLSMLADMGINIRSSKSPAFMGLLVVEVLSASANARKPWVQIRCEDDKSVYIKADSPNELGDAKEPSTTSSVSATSGPPALDALSRPSFGSSTGAASTRRRDFTWTDAKYVFVVAFSHSTMEVIMRDSGLPGLPKTNVGVASIPICKLKQGTHPETATLMNGSKEAGVVQLSIRYEWMRGTQDTGKRFYVDKVTVDPRKLKGLKVISHVSNVNHWLLSHDNVWAAVRPDHPALRMRSKSTDPAVGGLMGAPPLSTVHSKLPSVPEAGSSSLWSPPKNGTPPAAAENGESENDWDTSVSLDAGEASVDEPDAALRNAINGGDSVFATSDIGKGDEGTSDNAYSSLFEDTVMDALADSGDDNESTKKLRLQMAGILSLVNERFTALESTVQQQQLTIQELEYKLEMKVSGESVIPFISGRFGYGLGRPASKRRVLLFARRAQDSYVDRPSINSECTKGDLKIERPGIFLGMHKTDGNGALSVEVPPEIATTPGHYNISALLPQDNTFAKGSLYILKPGTQCVVMDMDGTLTVGDEQVVAQFALNAFGASIDVTDKLLTKKYDLKQRHHSRTLARLWTAKGYQVVYLSGRQGSFYNLTMQWLINHNYPPGPIHLTRTHVPTLPIYLSVGNFKVEYMQMLKRKGFHIYAAYGNTGTDVRAYAAAGVPKSRTFTIGQAAGAGNTVKITNWTKHLVDVLALPDATVPIPYVDVMWSDIPMYRNKAAELREENLKTVCGTLVSSDSQASVASSVTSDDDEAHAELNTLNVEDDDEESTSVAGPGVDEEMEASKAAAAAADRASKDAASMDRLMIAEPVMEEGEEDEDDEPDAAAKAAAAQDMFAKDATGSAKEGAAQGGGAPPAVTRVMEASAKEVIKSATAGAEEKKEVGAAMDVLERDGEKEEGAGAAVAAASAAEVNSLVAPMAMDDGFIVPPEHGGLR